MSKKGLILIVDDDSISRKILKNLFKDMYGIEEATNGKEALEIIAKKADTISVIILDLLMPGMNGYAVLEELGRDDKWKKIPVVIATSENTAESDQKVVDLGVFHILHKPVNVKVVKKQISNIVNRYEANKEHEFENMIQKTMIHNTTNTFLCVYHFSDHTVNIGDNYSEFVGKDFPGIFDSYPFQLEDFVLPKNMDQAGKFFDVLNKKEAYEEIELRIRADAVYYRWFKISMLIHYEEDNTPDHVSILFTDIESEIEAREKLTFMAMNDVLTHIPNMRTFAGKVSQMLKENPQEDFLMITMDIYKFNLVNKLFGYSEGDGVIKYFATKIQELVETYDKGVYCRMASDIFYACFSENEDLEEFINIIQETMRNYPIKYDLRLCFGVYKIVDREENVENMIDHSSYARAEAKKSPLHAVQYYDDILREREYFETVVISDMGPALSNGEFEVYLQPKYNIVTGKIIGSEALIRWKHQEKGYLSPKIFIPIFEQNGFITELDYYVYEVVCKTLRRWLDQGRTPLPISVNVSRCDLYDSTLIDHIKELVEKYQLPHDLMEFEITESAFVLEPELLISFTDRLREAGFRVLIDDFGSGYSALNSLKDIQVDILKIDMKFLPADAEEVRARIILSAVIEMAQKLGLAVIAEGVETQEQVAILESLSCEQVQGFYYDRPMSIEKFEEKMR